MVKRHVEKLLRLIPKVTEQYPNIECFTVPVFPRMIRDGELIRILYDAFAMNPAVHPSQVCIEVSADILYEDTETVKARLEEIRELGVKVAINEVGDEYCPFFKLSSLPFDMIFLDGYATDILETSEAEQVMGGLIQYLKSFGVPVIAPELETDAQLAAAKLLECDGYSLSPTATIYEEEETEEEVPAEEEEEEVTEETEEVTEETAEETPEETPEEEETPVGGDVLDAPPTEETEATEETAETAEETPVGGGAFDAPPTEETEETAETAATEFTDADSPVDQVTGEEEINE
jgi:EAL domain-containing protein (putative c-di-GMP-specific phosphodiesterase class I)